MLRQSSNWERHLSWTWKSTFKFILFIMKGPTFYTSLKYITVYLSLFLLDALLCPLLIPRSHTQSNMSSFPCLQLFRLRLDLKDPVCYSFYFFRNIKFVLATFTYIIINTSSFTIKPMFFAKIPMFYWSPLFCRGHHLKYSFSASLFDSIMSECFCTV